MSDPWAFGWTQILTICGLAISALFAFRGLRTFDKWRQEQIEQRKIEVALEALAMAYEAKYVFEQIRSRLSTSVEWQDMPQIAGENDSERLRRGSYYAIFKRMQRHSDFFDRTWKLQPKFMAVFGVDSEKTFGLLHKARSSIEVACETLMWEFKEQPSREDKENRDFWLQMRTDIWASPGPRAERDQVGRDLDSFVEKIEVLCRPVIKQGYKAPKAP